MSVGVGVLVGVAVCVAVAIEEEALVGVSVLDGSADTTTGTSSVILVLSAIPGVGLKVGVATSSNGRISSTKSMATKSPAMTRIAKTTPPPEGPFFRAMVGIALV